MKIPVLAASLSVALLVTCIGEQAQSEDRRFWGCISERELSRTSNVVMIGDSLTDSGAFSQSSAGGLLNPPLFYNQVFSNGPVWSQYWAENFGFEIDHYGTFDSETEVYNYSYGGALSGPGNITGAPDTFGATAQLSLFKNDIANGVVKIDRSSLGIVSFASNDYLTGVTDVEPAIANTMAVMQGMLDAGIRKFLVWEIAPLGETPFARMNGLVEPLNAISELHNRRLRQELRAFRLKNRRTRVRLFSLTDIVKELVSTPSSFGLSDIGPATGTDLITGVLDFSGAAGPEDTSVFWDSIHPTSSVHRIIADKVVCSFSKRKKRNRKKFKRR